ncbi:MAG: FHA domain-containing protein [Gloeobacteraceae cyanobacterium ES-bin-144]|nr:FHA domain-containing protein [Verrucomicrobiales bacterium]
MPRVTITVTDKNPQPYRFQLDRQVVTLGRGSENDIPIECGSTSVNHAEMHRVEGGYELRDLDSTNGIKLDGVRYERIPLQSGMIVKLGEVAFDFLLSDEEAAVLAREKPPQQSPIIREEWPGESAVNENTEDTELEEQPQKSGGCGFGMLVLVVVLAMIAFAVGLAIRFKNENGRSLLEAIRAKQTPATAPASTAPKPGTTK